MESLLLSIREAARLLKISERLTWQLAKEGKLPTIRLGTKRGRLLIPRKALEDWILNQTSGGKQN
jgi:excisionase family DNA binding protein